MGHTVITADGNSRSLVAGTVLFESPKSEGTSGMAPMGRLRPFPGMGIERSRSCASGVGFFVWGGLAFSAEYWYTVAERMG